MKTYKGFYDISHMNNYLSKSLIRIQEEPIWVNGVVEGDDRTGKVVPKIKYKLIATGRPGTINLYSKRVNLDPVRLGFVNVLDNDQPSGVVARACRMPARMWKIGLSPNNLVLDHVPYEAGMFRMRIGRDNILASKSLRNTVLGIFPSFTEALATTRAYPADQFMGVAFNRKFCLINTAEGVVLYYYHFPIPVGRVSFFDYRPPQTVLAPEFAFLTERYNEAQNAPHYR